MIHLNQEEIKKWFDNNGDNTHNITYDLDENSVIIDLGGFTGVWAQQMIEKYNPNVYIVEPVFEFYDSMVVKFSKNKKVRLMNVGVSIEDKEGIIYKNNDGTSTNLLNGESVNVKFKTLESILKEWDLEFVDLIQINIEGDEYPILERMLESNFIKKFKNIQVQFHLGVRDEISRRETIRLGLKQNGFEINFDYPFVWESWKLNK